MISSPSRTKSTKHASTAVATDSSRIPPVRDAVRWSTILWLLAPIYCFVIVSHFRTNASIVSVFRTSRNNLMNVDVDRMAHGRLDVSIEANPEPVHNSGARFGLRPAEVPLILKTYTWDPNPNAQTALSKKPFSRFNQQFKRDNVCPDSNRTSRERWWLQDTDPTETTSNSSSFRPQQDCKLLWFAGMIEGPSSQCNNNSGGYKTSYAASLQSARIYASTTLQPVLMLGQYGLNRDNPNELSRFGKWAQEQGAIVMNVPELSFQRELNEKSPFPRLEHRMGPWMRFEISNMIRQYGLFELPGVCRDYALYTDSDVLFMNPVSGKEIRTLLRRITPRSENDTETPFVMYGPQRLPHAPVPENSGVMLFDILRWEQEWPKFFEHGMANNFKFPGFTPFDQGWINSYFSQQQNQHKRTLLPLTWNWKAYWGASTPDQKQDLRVLHFHGPKPARGLDEIAHGSVADIQKWSKIFAYQRLILEGLYCDEGRLARYVLLLYNTLLPSREDYCDA